MEKIAIDIALLLPENINKICRKINKESPSESNLSKSDNYPHITLAMGIIDKKDLGRINNKLEEIIKESEELNLRIVSLYYGIIPEDEKSYVFKIERERSIFELHKKIMKSLSSLFSYELKKEHLFLDKDEKFSEATIFFVKEFSEKHKNSENYNPHISLKCNKAKYDNFPLTFKTDKLAICHLGNCCTCRTILKSFKLKSHSKSSH